MESSSDEQDDVFHASIAGLAKGKYTGKISRDGFDANDDLAIAAMMIIYYSLAGPIHQENMNFYKTGNVNINNINKEM